MDGRSWPKNIGWRRCGRCSVTGARCQEFETVEWSWNWSGVLGLLLLHAKVRPSTASCTGVDHLDRLIASNGSPNFLTVYQKQLSEIDLLNGGSDTSTFIEQQTNWEKKYRSNGQGLQSSVPKGNSHSEGTVSHAKWMAASSDDGHLWRSEVDLHFLALHITSFSSIFLSLYTGRILLILIS